MRFKTFRNLVVAGGATAVAGLVAGGYALYASMPERPKPQPTPVAVAPSNPGPQAIAPSSTSFDPSLRPVDRMLVEFLARPATSDKVKDAFPRESFKVNIYRDGGGSRWARLKIDLDRDEVDDEKWDLVDGQPAKRHVSTADNGTYDVEYRWRGGRWEPKTTK